MTAHGGPHSYGHSQAHSHAHLSEAELNDLIDGRLAPGAHTQAIRHLADCQRCVEERDALAQVVTVSHSARTPLMAPDELWTMVSASTIHERALRRQVLRSMRGVLAVGALAIMAATAGLTLFLARGVHLLFPPPSRVEVVEVPEMVHMPDLPPMPSLPPLPPPPPPPHGDMAHDIEHARQMAEDARRQAEDAIRRAEEAMVRAAEMRRAAEDRLREARRP